MISMRIRPLDKTCKMIYFICGPYLDITERVITTCLQIQEHLKDAYYMKRQDKFAARKISENNASMPKYTIGVVSQLLGLPPQMLRRYEEAGLLEPARQGGKNRLYSDQDIEILEEITELSAQGINAVGIRYIIQVRRHVLVLQQEVQQAREAQIRAEEEWRRLEKARQELDELHQE
jgi:MerR family transcriptional regulator, heat shock protein HspR